MNTQFNSALKQSTSLKRDLANLTSSSTTDAPTPAALGSVSAALTAFARTLDEYTALARQEPSPAKQDKAHERLRNFRAELADYRARFDELKRAREETLHATNRSELLGRRPFAAATPENPYANATTSLAGSVPTNRYGSGGVVGGAQGQMQMAGEDYTREVHVMREQNFFAQTNNELDEYISRGQAVLGDLGTQREMLKNTQKRLYSVANTLGVSGDTIRMIERRAKQDKWIFWAGVIVFFAFCWLCLHFLR